MHFTKKEKNAKKELVQLNNIRLDDIHIYFKMIHPPNYKKNYQT